MASGSMGGGKTSFSLRSMIIFWKHVCHIQLWKNHILRLVGWVDSIEECINLQEVFWHMKGFPLKEFLNKQKLRIFIEIIRQFKNRVVKRTVYYLIENHSFNQETNEYYLFNVQWQSLFCNLDYIKNNILLVCSVWIKMNKIDFTLF